jgi:hypothetical protein
MRSQRMHSLTHEGTRGLASGLLAIHLEDSSQLTRPSSLSLRLTKRPSELPQVSHTRTMHMNMYTTTHRKMIMMAICCNG